MDRWREDHTRYGVIDPIIQALGWNTADRKECHPDLWLTGRQHPDHNTLWRFYRVRRKAMRSLFRRTVRTAVKMELVDLAVQAVDGTGVLVNASLYRTHDTEGLGRLLERLVQAIKDLEAQNEAGEDAPAVHLPEELADKKALQYIGRGGKAA